MEFESIVNYIINNGVAVGLLIYFVYRDNKFMNNLATTLKMLQISVDSIKDLIGKEGD